MTHHSAVSTPVNSSPPTRALLWAALLNALWINASEVFRYFLFVMPMLQEAFPQLPGVVPMSWPVFAIWGVWDSIMVLSATGFCWLSFERFGTSIETVLGTATAFWLAVFVVLWLGVWNMNLTTTTIVLTALPLAWFEIFIAALIVRWCLTNRN